MTDLIQIKNKRIFIAGGAGFIGPALVRRLLKDNEIVAQFIIVCSNLE